MAQTQIRDRRLRAFYEKAAAFIERFKANGGPDPCFAVTPGSEEFVAWERYFSVIGIRPWFMAAAQRKEIPTATVPAQWPQWFDATESLRDELPPAGIDQPTVKAEAMRLSPEEQRLREEFANAALAEYRAVLAGDPGQLAEHHRQALNEARERMGRLAEEERARRFESAGLDPYEHDGLGASPELRTLMERQAEERA